MVAASINARGVQKMHVNQRPGLDAYNERRGTAKALKSERFAEQSNAGST